MTTKDAYAYGTELARADAGALGQIPGPDGPDKGNGFPAGRAHAHVRPSSHPNRSETHADAASNAPGAHSSRVPAYVRPEAVSEASTGRTAKPASGHVGPILNGNTDTRGQVSEEERAHLQPFGADVRTLRKAAGLSQERLGKLAGIGPTHISRLEQGRRRPSVDAITALARILAPEGTTDAVEQRLARLAGDSLRTGAVRRKRQRDNKHRLAALREMERSNRKLKSLMARRAGGSDLHGLVESGEAYAASMRAGLEAEPAGIRGVVPVDEQARRNRYGYSRPRSRSMKDIRAWLAENHVPGDDADDDEVS